MTVFFVFVFFFLSEIEPIPSAILAGRNVSLDCRLQVVDQSELTVDDIQWYHGSTELPKSVYFTINGNVSRLSLTNVSVQDRGLYQCCILSECNHTLLNVGGKLMAYIRPWAGKTYGRSAPEHVITIKHLN